MIGLDPEHVTLARPAAAPSRCRRPRRRCPAATQGERHARSYSPARSSPEPAPAWSRSLSHPARGRRPAGPDPRSRSWAGTRPIDEGMTVPRGISCETTNLAVCDLAGRAGVLVMHPARSLAMLEEASLVEKLDRFWVGQRLQRILTHHVAQGIRIPASATEQRPADARARHRLRLRLASSRSCAVQHRAVRSRNAPAEAATRSWLNRGRMRPFTSRSDEATAQASSRPKSQPSMMCESWDRRERVRTST